MNGIIPIYLQKNIIKLLCNHINRNNKLIESLDELKDYRDVEIEIKKLTKSISLVNKIWFKTIQKNLDVSVDLNFKENDYSIIKFENIKTLKIHYDHQKDYFYKLKINNTCIGGSSSEINTNNSTNTSINEIEIQISIEEINNRLKLLSTNNNFKRLIIRNIEVTYYCFNILDKLYQCDVTKSNIELLEIEINNLTTIEYLNKYKDRIKKLYSITINFSEIEYQDELLIEMFQMWYNKGLKQLFLISLEIYFPILQILSNSIDYNGIAIGKGINYLESIEEIEFFTTEVTLDDLLIILSPKLLPKLFHLSFEICFDKLIYFLSTQKEREEFKIKKCICGCIFQDLFGNDLRDFELFNEKWNGLLNLVKNIKSLNCLKINHYCKENGDSMLWKNNSTFPQSFIDNITNLVSSIKSIVKFSMVGAFSSDIFVEILRKNQNIIHFESFINLILRKNFTKEILSNYKNQINQLIKTNNHIQSFKFIKIDYIKNAYKESILIDYKK